MTPRRAALAVALLPAAGPAVGAQDVAAKPPIRGLVSVGAYRFVGGGFPTVPDAQLKKWAALVEGGRAP